MISIDFEEFFTWLASHAPHESVGQPGRCFHSPLACFLSAKCGFTIGENGFTFGRSVMDDRCWLSLPAWAQVFATLSERFFGTTLSAYEAVGLLAQAEAALSSLRAA